MPAPNPLLLSLYRGALVLYPVRLRHEYREQMLQTLHDAHSERRASAVHFWFRMYADLFESSLTERMYMLRESALKRPVFLYTLALAAVLTLLGGGAAITMQQMLRRGADQPQIEMAKWYTGEINSGEAPADVIPPGYVDLGRSLQPFVIFYDDRGTPGPGTGYLDQVLPAPPAGVFDFVRSHGVENITWQPRSGVRIASVVIRVNGKNPGFLLAGRSLRVVELQTSLLRRMVIGGWIVVMLLLIAGASLLSRAQRLRPVAGLTESQR
jgi:hypothetical protein